MEGQLWEVLVLYGCIIQVSDCVQHKTAITLRSAADSQWEEWYRNRGSLSKILRIKRRPPINGRARSLATHSIHRAQIIPSAILSANWVESSSHSHIYCDKSAVNGLSVWEWWFSPAAAQKLDTHTQNDESRISVFYISDEICQSLYFEISLLATADLFFIFDKAWNVFYSAWL